MLLCLFFAGPMAGVSTAANLQSFTGYWALLATWSTKSPQTFNLVSSEWSIKLR